MITKALILLAVVCVLDGCQAPKPAPPTPGGAAQSTRNNCYSLLHQLLDDEKDVSMLRFIKREHIGVKELVKRIAAASGAGSTRLEEFAKLDPSLRLNDLRLPLGEVAAREAIGAIKKRELLGQKGGEFELTLLLTQTEALSYAANLAKVAAENDSHPDRASALAGISAEMTRLNHEVFVMLLSKTR